ncbi:unnamed protein product, partial [Mesorhabditis belari]|uniref:Syndetin n=1 Tax=Mesorhabditis belari TaxID=2138241 RepID=A0AAF3E8P9_9BILA
MEKLRGEFSSRLAQLGSSLASSNEDAIMDDMTDYVPSPYEGPSTSADAEPAVILVKKEPRNLPRTDALNEADIVNSIDAIYFAEDEDFDAIAYELQKLSCSSEMLEDIERERLRLKQQLGVVSKRIAALILEKSPSYSAQMNSFTEIRDELTELTTKVKTIRKALNHSKKRTTTALRILANEKKKAMLGELKETLHTIKTLYVTEFRLRELIEEGQFPMAIELCARMKEAALTYNHFTAVNDLMLKLSGTSQLIEAELASSLPQLIVRYDADRYAFVVTAYTILEKQQEGADELVNRVCTSLDSSARSVLLEEISSSLPPMADQLELSELSKRLKSEELTGAFQKLGRVLCKILSNYHAMLRHNIEEDERIAMASGDHEINEEKCIFQATLRAHLPKVFKISMSLVTTCLSPHNLSHLSFDDLLMIVDFSNRFRRFGIVHFGADCDALTRFLEEQALLFFGRFHGERLSELCMFLENEIFALCPVPYQFTIFDLQEFAFLKETRKGDEVGEVDGGEMAENGYTIMTPNSPLPFSNEENRRSQLHSVSSLNGCEVADLPTPTTHRDLEPNYLEPADHVPPNLCNTALNLLRFFGRYMRMTTLVPALATSSMPAITQLFNYFFFSLYSFFGQDGPEVGEISPILKKTLEILKSSIALHIDGTEIHKAALSCAIQLHYPDQLFSAAERIMAVESLEFVARQLDLMRPVIESLAQDSALLDHLERFHSQVVSVVPEMRVLVISCVANKALKFPVFVQKISQTKWDIHELQSQHSEYADFILKDVELFCKRLDAVSFCVTVSPATRRLFWDRLIYYTFKALVQGFSESAGKCSSEGRALMQLDFQHLLGKLEAISSIRPFPHTAFVDAYIKAYYLPEASLEQWVVQHSEYSPRQLISLLNTASHVSKKARQRIVNALDL